MDRELLEENLKRNVILVTFRKKDGELREMRCTLMPEHMGVYEKKTEREKIRNIDIIPVWDMDKNEFRSFRCDSVITMKVA